MFDAVSNLDDRWKAAFRKVEKSRLRALQELSAKLLSTGYWVGYERLGSIKSRAGHAESAADSQLEFKSEPQVAGFWSKFVPRPGQRSRHTN